MERRQLEDRLRASLQARADDVQPTPELWERVSTRTTRRARWQLGAWVLSGTAAVVAIVVGGIVLFGSPRSVQIEPEPDIVDTPDLTEPTEEATPAPGGSATPTVVTTDGSTLFRIDPATGEVVADLAPRAGLQEGAAIREVAVRPVGDEGVLTVATVIEIEGGYDVEVHAFDADGNRIDRLNIGSAAPAATDLPPDVVWSEDGRYVMWAGSSGPSGPALWAYDWVERPVDDNGIAEPFTAAPPGTPAELFQRDDVVDLRQWSGPSDGQSTVVATTTTGGAYRIDLTHQPSDCGGATPCPPTFAPSVQDLGFEGGSAMDLGTLDSGVSLALMARPSQGGQDAEGATLELVAEPMSDQVRRLELPELTTGTAAPPDAWMAVSGNRVAVGFGPQAAYLLTISGDVVEDLEVADTVPLPDGTMMAGAAAVRFGAGAGDAEEIRSPSPTPSEGPATSATLLEDGLPSHVVSYFPSAEEFLLQDRRTPDDPVVTWARPTGVPADMLMDGVAVWPGSTPARLQVVSAWVSADRTVLARTEVVDGAITTNEAFTEDLQPARGDVLSRPVFAPDGNHLAWLESAGSSDVLRVVRWQGGSPSSDLGATPLEGVPPLAVLEDWAVTDTGSVLTAMVDEATRQEVVEIELLGTDGPIVLAEDTPTVVDLPGRPLAAGSFDFDSGHTRYVVYDADVVRYALAEAPETGVDTGLPHSEAGRIVAFGPDSLVVQLGDGSWQRVQVDDGATSAVEAPRGTVAVLPWPTG